MDTIYHLHSGDFDCNGLVAVLRGATGADLAALRAEFIQAYDVPIDPYTSPYTNWRNWEERDEAHFAYCSMLFAWMDRMEQLGYERCGQDDAFAEWLVREKGFSPVEYVAFTYTDPDSQQIINAHHVS